MTRETKLKSFLILTVAAALAAVLFTSILFPPNINTAWLIAFGTLLALAIVSALLALKITEGGSTTAMDFVPQLGAVLLLGPFGTVALTAVEQLFTEFILQNKQHEKALFNTAQILLAAAVASLLYIAFGGEVGSARFNFTQSFPPFIVAVIGYFAVNTVSVSYIIALAEGKSFLEVWRQAAGNIIVFDLAMSPLAFLVAYLYVRMGAIALLAAIVPIIGLRYSYGVNIELQQLNQDLLRVLIKTLEARDTYTSGHSVRVAERSQKIARALNLRPREVRIIETAALLHDIGKIDLAYSEILRQAGPLTPIQRKLIRAHPDKGVEIISSVRSLDPEILSCVRHHHEWYDGSGYPAGLAGKAIPLGARIIMISDAIDAMLTDRPYRSALSVEEVEEELRRNRGTQFDPQLVEKTLEVDVLETHSYPRHLPSVQPAHSSSSPSAPSASAKA